MLVVLNKKVFPKNTTIKNKEISLDKRNVVNKSTFEIECEKGFTVEESRKRVHDKIGSLWEK